MTASADDDQQPPRFNAKPILNEIRHGVDRLLNDGQTTTIDLSRLPFDAEDERYLREALGDGEVYASVNALGESKVQETGVAGVWWVTHFDAAGAALGKYIEITTVPGILKSQPEDMLRGLHMLNARLGADQTITSVQEQQ